MAGRATRILQPSLTKLTRTQTGECPARDRRIQGQNVIVTAGILSPRNVRPCRAALLS